jgi:hypothetical protein
MKRRGEWARTHPDGGSRTRAGDPQGDGEKCEDMKQCEGDLESAIAYAQELICASFENLDCSRSVVDGAAAAV